jgi:hypothetical protein
MVAPSICLSVPKVQNKFQIFLWIDLKFGGDLQVDVHFLFLHFFLLSSSSKSSFSSFSSFYSFSSFSYFSSSSFSFSSFTSSSSEFEFLRIYKGQSSFWERET